MSLLRRSPTARIVLGIIGLILTVLLFAPGVLVEYLWMDSLDYSSVFWTILGLRAALFGVVFLLAALYFGGNLLFLVRRMPPLWASRWAREGEPPTVGGEPLTRARLKRLALAFAALLSLLFATGFAGQWDELLRYANAGAYGETDPIYGNDLAFYMLELPFIQAVQSGVVGLAFLGLLVLVTVYVLMGDIGVQNNQFHIRASVARHLGANIILLLLGWTWGFYLDRYELLMSGGGAVYGAGYTDINATLPALWVMVVATFILAAIIAINLYQYRLRLLAYGIILYVVTLVVGLVVIPTATNQFTVVPNELEVERPYLAHNIDLTREAYELDDIEERSYPARVNLTMEDVQNNQQTIQNVRLWDPRLLIDTYSQLQQIRLYYQFYNVDVDRYTVNGEYRQVMLAARELTQELPNQADTWFNRHLQYTHGYGSVMNLVAREGTEGSPEFLIKDLPPVVEDSSLAVDEPAIYYGEGIPTYRIVSTSAQELDYPQGDDNVYTTYDGDGGVLLNSFWKELLFAYYMGDFNILLSGYLTDDSRIQFWNRVQTRVDRVAPFLELDQDPYFVVSDQRQYWIQDAYTTTRSFPYAEPVRRFGRYNGVKYIRNSVKVVVDAYSGDVSFYVMDTDDPILKVYIEAFPELFKPFDEMPQDLQNHVRYPQDLFEMQVEKYSRYHMTSPQVFYNNEDLWTRPMEQYAGQSRQMEPYYILSRLPDEERQQFMLMTPMTPDNRDNMIGWIAAKCDNPNYGELIVYKLPKDRLIYGPNQVESRIDQDGAISEQLSLWDQRGSRVVRGNLIVVPIEESFLYVEPVYLIAENLSIPQLRRVIASYGELVAMEPTLEGALNSIFGRQIVEPDRSLVAEGPLPARIVEERSPAELERARTIIEEAREALQDGDFATFGERFNELEEILQERRSAPVDTAASGVPTTPASETGSPAGDGSGDTGTQRPPQ